MKIEIEKPIVPKWFDDWYKDVPTEQDGYGATKEEHAIQLVSQVGWGNGLYKSMSNFERGDEERVRYVLDNKTKLFYAILFGYEVEKEPLYYARVKGWEYLPPSQCFWSYIPEYGEYVVADRLHSSHQLTQLTIEEWNELGINDTNADFREV